MASLLLRLFHSDYFSPHLALSYLKTYSDNIGITYYLVEQLDHAFPAEDVEFYWPQLCHLLITKPSESRALECFVLDRCERSVHVALLTLWYFQAALSDLASNPHTASFQVCQRVFNQCQRILFEDPLASASTSLLTLPSTSTTSLVNTPSSPIPASSSTTNLVGVPKKLLVSTLNKVRVKILPSNSLTACVGMGAVLASSPGMPNLSNFSGRIAIQQGRRPPDNESARNGIGAGSKKDGDEDEGNEENNEGSGSEDEAQIGEDSGEEEIGDESVNSKTKTASPNRTTATASNAKQKTKPSPIEVPSGSKAATISSATSPSSLFQAFTNSTSPIKGKRAENPFASFATGFNDFRDKATAAVGDVFGQTFGVEGIGTSNEKATGTKVGGSTRPPPSWHPQRKSTSSNNRKMNSDSGFGQRAANSRSVPNLVAQQRGSLSAFASTVGLNTNEDGSLSFNSPEMVLSLYDMNARRRLLKANYCRVQTQFLLNLQDISARLLLLPKPARLSALRAELTALNHKLPAEVCFPLWCEVEAESTGEGESSQDDEKPTGGAGRSQHYLKEMREGKKPETSVRHHRVVRINPSEAVVLNSADRAPYLLHVEVLKNDLDFDPERRGNRESLKKLVVKEDERRRKIALSRGLDSSSKERLSSGDRKRIEENEDPSRSSGDKRDEKPLPGTPKLAGSNVLVEKANVASSSPNPQNRADGEASTSSTSAVPQPPPPRLQIQTPEDDGDQSTFRRQGSSPFGGEDDEEVDLTEQAYGEDLSSFGEERDVNESEEEDDLAQINLSHDNAAWSHAISNGKHPSTTGASSPDRSRRDSQTTLSPTNTHLRNGSISNSASKKKDFSLDEYSERMRTAAIMLAQLNQSTNASNQPIITHNPHVSATAQGGWSSWIVGTSWASGAASPLSNSTAKSEAGQGSAGVKAPVMVNGNQIQPNTGTAPSSPRISTSTESGSSNLTPSLAQAVSSLTTGSSSASGSSQSSAVTSAASSRLIHADTEAIRKRIMQEMMALEEERMERMKQGGKHLGRQKRRGGAAGNGVEDEATIVRAVNKDDPSAAMLKESWAAKKARIRASSPYGHLTSWDVFSVIVKTGADLRQEQLAVQLINEFGRIWKETNSKCWTKYFRILVTSENSALMETITDALSIHSIKKEAYSRHVNDAKIATYSLYDHYLNTFGEPSSAKFNRAREKFMESLAAYSIISYLLQIKDRHNGNILIDNEGHLIHIDFGFMLGISPGGVGFEAAPFKMPQEYIDILGGVESPKFEEFRKLMRSGFRDVRKHAERIIMIVELMQKDSKLPCFALGDLTAANLRDRFQLALSQSQCDEFVDKLVLSSAGSAFTRLYDQFHYSQGIL